MSKSIDFLNTEIINFNGKEVAILQLNGEEIWSNLLKPTSAKLFIFNSNDCIGYVGDSSLKKITIPKSYSIDSDGKFIDGTNYSVSRLMAKDSISGSGFKNYSGEIILLDNITVIGYDAFRGCSGLTSITIPDSVTSIGVYAFSGCSNLTSIKLPKSFTVLSSYMFAYCTSLTDLSFLENVNHIGQFTFRECTGLTSVELSNSITQIYSNAFTGCSNLTSMVIPKSVTFIGTSVFDSCVKLKTLKILSTTPPNLSGQFGTTSITRIEVPSASLSAYQSATNWSKYADIMVGV